MKKLNASSNNISIKDKLLIWTIAVFAVYGFVNAVFNFFKWMLSK